MVAAKEFVSQIVIPLRDGWGYIYGTAGKVWTQVDQEKMDQTEDSKRAASRQYGSQWIGNRVTDCSGLLVWALKQIGEKIVHHARYQYTDWCTKKGKLTGGVRDDGLPLLPGMAVFLQAPEAKIHHVGVYIGNGTVVEAKGAKYGVVTSKPDHWDHWGELNMIDYSDAASLEDNHVPMPEKQFAIVDNPNQWLNVRNGAGSSYPVRFQVPKGSTVEVLSAETDDEWWQIKYGNQIGWAFSKYLKPVDDGSEEPDSPSDDEEPEKGTEAEQRLESVWERLMAVRTRLNELEKEVSSIMEAVDEIEVK